MGLAFLSVSLLSLQSPKSLNKESPAEPHTALTCGRDIGPGRPCVEADLWETGSCFVHVSALQVKQCTTHIHIYTYTQGPQSNNPTMQWSRTCGAHAPAGCLVLKALKHSPSLLLCLIGLVDITLSYSLMISK